MRKADAELLEMRLEPLQTARDRHNEAINSNTRRFEELQSRVTELERDRDAHSLTVAQAANSVRSLLQQANRKLRDARIIEDEPEEVDTPPPETPSSKTVRTHRGRMVL